MITFQSLPQRTAVIKGFIDLNTNVKGKGREFIGGWQLGQKSVLISYTGVACVNSLGWSKNISGVWRLRSASILFYKLINN